MTQQKPKVYTAEFRESSVKLAIESGKPVAQTAREIGVNENTLHTWISKYSRPIDNIKAVRTDEHLYEELNRLKKEVARGARPIKKGCRVLCQGTTVKYAWIKQHQGEFTVLSMCRFLQVLQSAYYDWLHRIPSFREREDEQLSDILKKVFEKSRNTYGTRRLKIAMSHQGRSVGRRRISRLMKEAGLACKTKRRFKATTNSKHELPIAPNYLDRQFSIDQINQVYVGDLTYIHTLEGWLYLAVVIDLFSRQVVGWSMAAHMKTQLVNDALQMAIWKRKPDKGLLWHTDRGSQYASESHRQLLKQHGIRQSMSRKSNCWDTQFRKASSIP
jgi:transposase-like protein